MRSPRSQRVELVGVSLLNEGRPATGTPSAIHCIHTAVGAELFQHVVKHSFECKPELDRVSAVCDEGIIVELAGCPTVLKAVQAAQSDCGE